MLFISTPIKNAETTKIIILSIKNTMFLFLLNISSEFKPLIENNEIIGIAKISIAIVIVKIHSVKFTVLGVNTN